MPAEAFCAVWCAACARRRIDAKPHFELMAGAYYWDDELPPKDNVVLYVACNLYLRRAYAYRHSLSLGNPRAEFEDEWNKLKLLIPNWPGFSEERIHGRAARMAKISQRIMERNLNDRDMA